MRNTFHRTLHKTCGN